jgi:hypothetical protein
VLPLKGAIKIQHSRLSGEEDCSEAPVLPPDRKVISYLMEGKIFEFYRNISTKDRKSSIQSIINNPSR